MTQATTEREWLTVSEYAQRFNYSPDYIRQLCREGRLETTQAGKLYLIRAGSHHVTLAK